MSGSRAQAQSIPVESTVYARVNTGAVVGDADDPAIWVHPTDPAQSLVIGTDKIGDFVYVWDMNGQERQRIAISRTPNNGDVRYGMQVGGVPLDIYVVGAQGPSRVVVFKIDPATLTLTDITTGGGVLTPQVKEPYGVCLYRRLSDGAMYVFVNSNGGVTGVLNQYQLLDDGTGRVKGIFVRSFGGDVNGNHSEGMVADDELGYVYIAEEDCCVHKFYADPNKGNGQITAFAYDDGIEPDREGLAIYGCPDGTGYILLSSQGNKRVKVYRREGDPGNPHSHTLVTTLYTPDINGTDGIDVTNLPAGPNFPFGFLAKHDGSDKSFGLIAWEDIAQTYLTICPQAPPACDLTANFSVDESAACIGRSVNFTDLSTGIATGWSWDFGDGYTASEQNPAHAYAAPGNYTVKLTVSSWRCSAEETKAGYVTVASTPTAAFASSSVSGDPPFTADFIDQSTGNPSSWSWDFGDGSTSLQQNPSHMYSTPGDYTVTLTVGNGCGSTVETKIGYIHVNQCNLPVANFSASTTTGNVPLTVNFVDQSTGNPSSWSWNFGDGSTSLQQNPSHQYTTPGAYTVTLTVTNLCASDGESKTNYITVTSAPLPAANLALNKPATASSTFNSTFASNRAVDGSTNSNSYWRSATVGKDALNTWLRVDLGDAYQLSRGVVKWRNKYFAEIYRFQISNSGGSSDGEWTTVYTNNAGVSGTQDVAFTSPYAARYFRIRIDQNNKDEDQIFELECYAGVPKINSDEKNSSSTEAPHNFVLEQNYPNPFNPTTTINFQLPLPAEVSLSIFASNGHLVKKLIVGEMNAGRHNVVWDATNARGERVASGVYVYVLKAGEFSAQRKLVLMK